MLVLRNVYFSFLNSKTVPTAYIDVTYVILLFSTFDNVYKWRIRSFETIYRTNTVKFRPKHGRSTALSTASTPHMYAK